MRRVLGYAVLVAIGAAAGLGIIEAALRIVGRIAPEQGIGIFWAPDSRFGWRHVAGQEGTFNQGAFGTHEFSAHVRINGHGLRDVEHEYRKESGVFRILILGDSYMEGMQVDLGETFGRLLEERLRGRGPVEVINTGVAAYGTNNELLFFRYEGYRYHPDLVLLAFTTANDVRENYQPWNANTPGALISRPYFTLEKGNLVEHPAPSGAPWWQKSHLVRFVYERIGWRVGESLLLVPDVAPPSDRSVPWVPLILEIYDPTPPTYVQDAWQVTYPLIEAIRDQAAVRGAKLAVMLVDAPWAHDEDWWQIMTARHPVARVGWDRRRPNRLLDRFLEAVHIPALDLFDVFESAKSGVPLYFAHDPHWTPAGHRVAADAAARFLVSERLVP